MEQLDEDLLILLLSSTSETTKLHSHWDHSVLEPSDLTLCRLVCARWSSLCLCDSLWLPLYVQHTSDATMLQQQMEEQLKNHEHQTPDPPQWHILYYAQRDRLRRGTGWASVTSLLVDWCEAQRMHSAGLRCLQDGKKPQAARFLHSALRLVEAPCIISTMLKSGIDRPNEVSSAPATLVLVRGSICCCICTLLFSHRMHCNSCN